MKKDVHGEFFIDRFMSFWRGREWVFIRDLGDRRFLERFVGEQYMQRVLEADQPWIFKSDLVLVADHTLRGNGC